MGAKLSVQTCTATAILVSQQQIKDIHIQNGHPSIKRTLYFVKRIDPATSKAEIKHVIKNCEMSHSISPALMQWQKGQLEASDVWQRVGMDITHYGGNPFLYPHRLETHSFCHLTTTGSASILWQLLSIFYEQGALEEILTNNDTTFCSQQIRQFRLRYRRKKSPQHREDCC